MTDALLLRARRLLFDVRVALRVGSPLTARGRERRRRAYAPFDPDDWTALHRP